MKLSFVLTEPPSRTTALQIFRLLSPYRRLSTTYDACATTFCEACVRPHLEGVLRRIAGSEEILFVLPAFPTKSPNRAKTLGALPDMAEWCALEFLQLLCERIEQFYSPGARFIICSDGRVFGDLIDVPDSDITAYQQELLAMIQRLGADRLSLFDLDDVYPGGTHEQMRRDLVDKYAQSIDSIRAEVLAGGETLDLYRGVTRFLLEDRSGHLGTRTSAQREARRRAYGVIQRSRAWGKVLAERFPDALRLSIHPQPCGADKLGIKLLKAPDNWLTPWHGVAVVINDSITLMKREQAETLGATLIRRRGRPSHYVLGRSIGNRQDLSFNSA